MSAGHIPGTHNRTDIEGLRAVAVSLVLLYHLKFAVVSGGYVGVDVFFVVSGFLITQILVHELEDSRKIVLRDFWARRMRRILPMASLVVVLTVIATYLYLEDSRGPALIPVALGALGFCANIVILATTGDYLSGVALPSPLQHYWSLGVEEQFYLVWPIVLVLVAKVGRGRWRFWTVIAASALFAWSLSESIRITPEDQGAGYFLPQARAWEILAGAFIAILATRLERLPKGLGAPLGWIGLGAIVYAAFTFDDQTNFPGSLALIPVLGAVGVLIAAEAPWGPVQILRWGPLQKIGLWSFSIYLWHWPIIVIAEGQYGTLSNANKVVIIAVCIALSAISYHLIEHPFQWSKFLSERPSRTFVAGFTSLAVLLSVGGVLMATRPATNDEPAFAAPADLDEAEQQPIENGALPTTSAPPGVTTTVPPSTIPPPPVTPVNAFLVGDSVLAELRWFEQGNVSLQGFTYTLDAESCRRIVLKSCGGREDRTPNSATDALANFTGPMDVVVLVGGYHASIDSIHDELQEFAAAVAARGAKLILFNFKETLAFPAAGSDGQRSIYTDFNEVVKTMAADGSLGDVTVVDWNLFSYGQDNWFRSDGMHTTIIGTLALGWLISATIAAVYDNPCPVSNFYPCVVPEIADPVTDWLTIYGVPYTDTHCYEDGQSRKRVCTEDRQL